MSKEVLDDPTPNNSYNDFWDKIKKLEEESLKKIIEHNERKKNVNFS